MLMPIREITASNFGIKSSFASDKNPTMLQAESLLEHDFLTLLEWDSRVAKYGTQPFTVDWVDVDGGQRQYTPDVLVTYHVLAKQREPHLRPLVFEVKMAEELRREWENLRPKFKAAVAALRPLGVGFKIVTERHIRTPMLDNARFLLTYKTMRYINCSAREMEMQAEIRQAMKEIRESTPKALLSMLAVSDVEKVRYIPWIWWLMNVGIIKADFSQRLTMMSKIWSIDNGLPGPRG